MNTLYADPASSRAKHEVRSRRRLYRVTSAVLTLVMALAVLDWLQVTSIFGVSSTSTHASGGGYELDVRYATVTRPALATPFRIVVERPGGFDGPVTVAITREYLGMWDENGLSPAPTGETTMGEWLVWEFDPPEGDRLTIVYDGRIEPAAQSGVSGSVAVLEGDAAVVSVDFSTRVMP